MMKFTRILIVLLSGIIVAMCAGCATKQVDVECLSGNVVTVEKPADTLMTTYKIYPHETTAYVVPEDSRFSKAIQIILAPITYPCFMIWSWVTDFKM